MNTYRITVWLDEGMGRADFVDVTAENDVEAQQKAYKMGYEVLMTELI
jgi:hypothetical protein